MPALPSDPKPTRAEQRLARVQNGRLAAKTVAKSVAHQGVTARPMDQNLSKILDRKRAALRQQGTSAARLGQEPEVSETDIVNPAEGVSERDALVEANSQQTAAQRATSAARLRTAEGEMGLKKATPLPEPPDMAI